ncbi:MAG: NUDIX hydrolase [Sphingobium sp.]
MTERMEQGRPAATVVIVRDRRAAPAEILMMERASTMAFAAGALVFPGGALDDADHELGARWGGALDLEEAAARVAAIRETLEESGLGIGMTGPDAGAIDPAGLIEMRRGLASGAAFATLLEDQGVTLSLDRLVPFARWHPGLGEKPRRIFDTRFYLTRAPEGQEASADSTENVRLLWSSAESTITRCDAGQGRIIFPTRRNLERLAQFADFAAMAAHAAAIPVEKVRPWIEDRDGVAHLCIPGHLGYPITSELLELAGRG